MNLITETYFLTFKITTSNPTGRRYIAWFHLMGAIAFLQSAIKHIKRRNKVLAVMNLKDVFWQLGLAAEYYVGRNKV